MPRPRTLSLTDGALEAVVDVGVGGRVSSLRAFGLDVLVEHGVDLTHHGWFPMAPYAGRVRNGRLAHAGSTHHLPLTSWPHAIHGTVLAKPWEVVDAGPAHASLRVALGPGWPFPGHATHHLSLDGAAVRATLEVHAEDEPFPASCGWHPWFRRTLATGGPAVLHLDAGAMWENGGDGIPTGALVPPTAGPWDACFTDLRSPPAIEWPGALAMTVDSPCPHVVVFDQPADAICIEPQTGPPDGVNLRPELVHPGRPLVASVTVTFSEAQPAGPAAGWEPART
jgi:galactose mutarotase-like enzyme